MTTPWLKTGIQVAQNDRGANAHHHEQVSFCFEPSSPFYGQFSVQKWPFLGCFQDDRPENSRRSPVCQVGVCNEGRCSSMAIGLSNDGKWVFNKAWTMPWCHTVVHFVVKMSRFCAVFWDHRHDRGGTSLKPGSVSSTVISNALRKTRTQLGPSSSLDLRGHRQGGAHKTRCPHKAVHTKAGL